MTINQLVLGGLGFTVYLLTILGFIVFGSPVDGAFEDVLVVGLLFLSGASIGFAIMSNVKSLWSKLLLALALGIAMAVAGYYLIVFGSWSYFVTN